MNPTIVALHQQSKLAHVDECVKWPHNTDKYGYGTLGLWDRTSHSRHTLRAHKVMWEFVKGPVPPSLCVLHKCDVPACVNINHLWLGTHLDNMRDMVAKKRQRTSSGAIPSASHCLHGHVFDDANTYTWKNKRWCKACQKARYTARRRGEKE